VSAHSVGARRSLAKFRRFFKHGFHDPLYIDWERDYKWEAHKRWEAVLSRSAFSELLLKARQDTRAGSYERTLQTSAGEVNLKVHEANDG
jgi:hypothetical protein